MGGRWSMQKKRAAAQPSGTTGSPGTTGACKPWLQRVAGRGLAQQVLPRVRENCTTRMSKQHMHEARHRGFGSITPTVNTEQQESAWPYLLPGGAWVSAWAAAVAGGAAAPEAACEEPVVRRRLDAGWVSSPACGGHMCSVGINVRGDMAAAAADCGARRACPPNYTHAAEFAPHWHPPCPALQVLSSGWCGYVAQRPGTQMQQ